MANALTTSFTSAVAGGAIGVQNDETLNYLLTGTFSATLVLERSTNGGIAWRTLLTVTAPTSGAIKLEVGAGMNALIRWRCTAYTSGTAATSIYTDSPGFGVSPNDWDYYIQRGATIQTYRHLGDVGFPTPSSAAHVIDTLIAYPFPIGLTCRMDRLGFNITAGAAGSSATVGIYRATSATDIYPDELVVDGGAISTVAAGFKETTVDAILAPGLYWAAYLAGVLAPTVTAPSGSGPVHPIGGWTAANPPARQQSLRVAFPFAALPLVFPAAAAWATQSYAMTFARFSA